MEEPGCERERSDRAWGVREGRGTDGKGRRRGGWVEWREREAGERGVEI